MNEKTRLEFSLATTRVYFPLASVTVPLAVPRSTTFTPGMASPFSLVTLPETVNAKSFSTELPPSLADDADAAKDVAPTLTRIRIIYKKIADCNPVQGRDKCFFINSWCCDYFGSGYLKRSR